ncbi:hypothetical protein OS493_009754 [Desmophyllum pertusum]|uniref:VWFA domain-containing protein n=1 Tax=Desmophyllum pertusum TaxID=174260 RepID=A0A9X0CNR6_9CNID|nr:hypothetical protein OS493_009754 [Desmophyllum pertusum]
MAERNVVGKVLFLVFLCLSGEGARSYSQLLCSRNLDVIIAVDVSGSIPQVQLDNTTAFLSDLVNSFRISNTQQQINNIILTRGSTNITAAIERASVLLSTTTRNVPRVVVFITDGNTFGGPTTLEQPARELREQSNARVVGLPVGPADNINFITFGTLTGSTSQQVTLTFLKKTTSGNCNDDDDDSDSDDSDSDGSDSSDSDSDSDGNNCGVSSELKQVASLICGN